MLELGPANLISKLSLALRSRPKLQLNTCWAASCLMFAPDCGEIRAILETALVGTRVETRVEDLVASGSLVGSDFTFVEVAREIVVLVALDTGVEVGLAYGVVVEVTSGIVAGMVVGG